MSGIERWTRRVLETEARRRGIRDPEARSQLELVRLIARHDYAATRATRRVLGRMIGQAAGKLSGSQAPPPMAADERPRRADRSSAAWPPRAPHPARADSAPSAPTRPSAVQAPTPSSSAPVPPPSAAGTPAASGATPPPSAAAPTVRATVAEARPEANAAATQSQPDAPATPPPTAATSSSKPPARVHAIAPSVRPIAPEPPNQNQLDQARREPRVLHLSWKVTEQGAARARAVLGADGELVLRIVSVRPDPTQVVQSEVTEHGPIEPNGEWTAQLASEDTHCVSAIGLRSRGRFVSIVHVSSRP